MFQHRTFANLVSWRLSGKISHRKGAKKMQNTDMNCTFCESPISNELRRKGIAVSPCGVRCVWLRRDLETFAKRLKALEAKVYQEGRILNEAQMVAMERKKEKQEATGEIETEHPGYLGSQDTYYVGNIKGVGRIYQQTFIDTYSKVAFVKLYDRKNSITAAGLLNDRVLPFFEEHKLPLLTLILIIARNGEVGNGVG